jgi:hypothetical protein
VSISVVGAAIVAAALLNLALTVRRVAGKRAGTGPLVFSLATLALSIAVATRILPPMYRWLGSAAVEAYLLVVAGRALMRGNAGALAGYLPAPFARMVQTELRLLQLAFRAPALLASPRTASANTYGETSKWESFAVIALVALVPDSVLLALIPMPAWAHALLIGAGLYGTMWILGAYASVISMPHEISGDRRVFHNGIFCTIQASCARIGAARILSTDERRRVVRRNVDARAMFCPGAHMVAVEFEGDGRLIPLVGRSRAVSSPMFVSSDVPDQLVRLLLDSGQECKPPRPRSETMVAPVPSPAA